MLNSKQRAKIRSYANTQETVCTIGKEGLTDAVLESILAALSAREVIKVSINQNLSTEPQELADEIAKKLKADVAGVVGRKIILYKYSAKVKEHIDIKTAD
ncbi:MAG: YhbY family RNA-binding protein [Christensenellaceae bacterium]|jgi:RNA-binding protein|nr:YhbY family RNA-binding protein [Christensenellaceae bacterium]